MPARNTSATYAEYVSVSAVPPSRTGSTVTPVQPQRRDAQHDDHQVDDQRQTAEEVGVRGGERAQREEHGAAQGAGDGDEHAEDQDGDAADEQQPDVEPQPFEDLGERLARVLRVEERLLGARPARRARRRPGRGRPPVTRVESAAIAVARRARARLWRSRSSRRGEGTYTVARVRHVCRGSLRLRTPPSRASLEHRGVDGVGQPPLLDPRRACRPRAGRPRRPSRRR